tara:strand:+ start:36 stop:299 length:264 start_codon:yes stop_codon:yes gene_type:complete
MIKILLFKNNLVLISRVEEVGSEMGEPDCKLIDPFELKGEFLESWPSFTTQREMMVHSDSFLTIIEPDKNQLDKYQALTAKNVTEKS